MRLLPEAPATPTSSVPAVAAIPEESPDLLMLARRVGTPLSSEPALLSGGDGLSFGRMMNILVNGSERDPAEASAGAGEQAGFDILRLLGEIAVLERAAATFATEAELVIGSGVRAVSYAAGGPLLALEEREDAAEKSEQARSLARLAASGLVARLAHLEELRATVLGTSDAETALAFDGSVARLRTLASDIAELGREPGDRQS